MSGGATAFAATPDAAAYVPYAGAERVLASLEEWACGAAQPVRVLRGPEGAGKSMLLAVLAARVGRHALAVPLSASGLDPDTLARTLLDAFGAPWQGTPRVALARAVEQPGARRVLLLVDDADALVPRTEMWLFDFVRRSADSVHALLALRDERLAAELASAFQAGTPVLALDTPMARDEAEAFVHAELARGGVDAASRARFDAATLAQLHARSGGVPGRLRAEAAAILAAPAAPVVGAAPAVHVSSPIAAAEPATRLPGASAPAAAVGAAETARVAARPGPAERAPAGAPGPRAPLVAPPPPAAPEVRAARAEEPRRSRAARREPPPREPAPVRSTAQAAERGRTGARAAAADPTRSSVGSEARPARRGVRLGWLLVPAAVAVAYVAGFLTSQRLEAPRPGAAPPAAIDAPLPPVSAAPPRAVAPGAELGSEPAAAPRATELRAREPFAPPPLPDAGSPAPVAAAPGEQAAPGPPAEPPPVSAAASVPLPAHPAPADAATAADASAASSPPAGEPSPATASAAAPPAAAHAPPSPARRAVRRKVEVNVDADPGASIYVNGEPVGSGAVQGLELEPGPQRIEVRLPDGRVVERVIEVKGTRYDVRVR